MEINIEQAQMVLTDKGNKLIAVSLTGLWTEKEFGEVMSKTNEQWQAKIKVLKD